MNLYHFQIFFLCEDRQSLERAGVLNDKLMESCRNEAMIESDFCEYARLGDPGLRQRATQKGIAADMIIVSAHGTGALPGLVQDWMNELGALCTEKIVGAEFFDGQPAEGAKIFHRFLEKWTSQKGSFLFSNLFPDGRARAMAGSQ